MARHRTPSTPSRMAAGCAKKSSAAWSAWRSSTCSGSPRWSCVTRSSPRRRWSGGRPDRCASSPETSPTPPGCAWRSSSNRWTESPPHGVGEAVSASPASKAAGRPAAGSSRESSGDRAELAELRAQLREAQETIEAIRDGSVDSLVIGPPGQEQVYSVASADRTYRLLVEAMSEGAATVSPLGVILDANPRLGAMTGHAGSELTGTAVLDLVAAAHRAQFTRLLDVGAGDSAHGEVELTRPDGTTVPILLAVSGFDL